MSYQYFNPNPSQKAVGDCVIRAICRAFGYEWERAYIETCIQGFAMHDISASDSVWGAYLRNHGYKQYSVPDICPDCYTLAQFAEEHQNGTYVVKTDNHVTTVVNGIYYDSWDSGNKVVIYYYQKQED